jgi:hypothetical protein
MNPPKLWVVSQDVGSSNATGGCLGRFFSDRIGPVAVGGALARKPSAASDPISRPTRGTLRRPQPSEEVIHEHVQQTQPAPAQLLRARKAAETAKKAIAQADTTISRLMVSDLKVLTQSLQRFGWDPSNDGRLTNLLPADDRGLTKATVVAFLNRLHFRNGHDAMRAAEHADELLHPVARHP